MPDTNTKGAAPAPTFGSLISRDLLDEKAAADFLQLAPGTRSVCDQRAVMASRS